MILMFQISTSLRLGWWETDLVIGYYMHVNLGEVLP